MEGTEKATALVAPYCDIEERLRLVPPSAQVRGMVFRNVQTQLETHGKLGMYAEFFPEEKRSVLTYYPVSEFLVRMALAGALVASPERVHEGMFEISKGNARTFADSLLGKVIVRVLSRDPIRLLEQAMAGRRQSANYGHWEVRRHSDRVVEVVYENEYWWIESAVAGAAVGTFEACGIKAQIETKLVDRFNGSTTFRW